MMNKLYITILYTIKEEIKKKGTYIATIIIALVCLFVLPIATLVALKPESTKKNYVKKIYICDEIGYKNIDYKSLSDSEESLEAADIRYLDLTKYSKNKASERYSNCLKLCDKESLTVRIAYSKEMDIDITINLAKKSNIKDSTAQQIGEYVKELIRLENYQIVSENEEQLLELMTGVQVTVYVDGKGEVGEFFLLIKKFAPLIFALIIYFMTSTYGQSMSNGMVTEKTSKIIEFLVPHTRPRSLIIGKVLGLVCVAIGQIVIWTITLILGVLLSNKIAMSVAGKEFIKVNEIIDLMKANLEESAFSIGAILFFVLLLILGFLFYCIYAAICGSFINRIDEASSIFAVYTYTNVIAFMVVYMGGFVENKTILAISRYIPFCITYSMPVDVLIGNASLIEAFGSLVYMMVCIVIALIILGVVYEKGTQNGGLLWQRKT